MTLRNDDGRVELIMSDDGPGVAQEDEPRIFDRFYRADPVRNRQTSGTGLGLPSRPPSRRHTEEPSP